eukprot:scaffold102335_cov63-Phaeocystis_antarctica.AAC.5
MTSHCRCGSRLAVVVLCRGGSSSSGCGSSSSGSRRRNQRACGMVANTTSLRAPCWKLHSEARVGNGQADTAKHQCTRHYPSRV